jgi:hypothetical protein
MDEQLMREIGMTDEEIDYALGRISDTDESVEIGDEALLAELLDAEPSK